jgi:hypothetical protein
MLMLHDQREDETTKHKATEIRYDSKQSNTIQEAKELGQDQDQSLLCFGKKINKTKTKDQGQDRDETKHEIKSNQVKSNNTRYKRQETSDRRHQETKG